MMDIHVRNIFRTGIVRVITAIGTLFFNYVLTSNLKIDQVGEFLALLTEITVLSTICRFGFESYLLKYIGSDSHTKTEISDTVSGALLFVSVISLIITFVFSIFHYLFSDSSFRLLISIPFLSLLLITSNIFRGYKKPVISVLLENGGYLTLSTILILILIETSITPILSAQLGYLLSIIILLLFSLTFLFTNYINVTRPNYKKIIFNHLKPSFYLMLSNASQMLLIWAPFIVISFLANPTDTALYGLSQRLSFAVSLFLTVVTIVMSPYFSKYFHEGNLKKLRLAYLKSTLMFSPLVIIFMAIIFAYSNYILSYFGKEYLAAEEIFNILLISQTLNFILGPIGPIYNMSNQARRLSAVSAIFLLIVIILSIISYKYMSIIGVAYISLITSSLFKITLLIDFYYRYYKTSK